mgnify:CR=1 FL=1
MQETVGERVLSGLLRSSADLAQGRPAHHAVLMLAEDLLKGFGASGQAGRAGGIGAATNLAPSGEPAPDPDPRSKRGDLPPIEGLSPSVISASQKYSYLLYHR